MTGTVSYRRDEFKRVIRRLQNETVGTTPG